MKYPKIETLYTRNDKFKVTTTLRLPEFGLIKTWLFTEKIDGTNVRIMLFQDGRIEYRGRTDRAQFHPNLTRYLTDTFTPEKVRGVFERDDDGWPPVIIYGEGYGPKIQSGGKYRDDIAVRIFDVKIGEWWLNWESVQEIAINLNIKTAPCLGHFLDYLPTCKAELLDIVDFSEVAYTEGKHQVQAEGIVARTDPLLFDRRGNRVMWKLKFKDF